MQIDLSFTVPRHCVSVGDDGLSPLQSDMIRHPAKVRIFSAPTGSGKSFAFGRAVRDGAKVLFVVPTRRLAQNLADDFIGEFLDTGAKVALWTSDERVRLLGTDPKFDVRMDRIKLVRDLCEVETGTMVLATPESIAQMLLNDRMRAAHSPFYLQDLLGFDHVVFDEFHTISARGFGLAGALCRVVILQGDDAPRVTFLSATPIDIKPTLVGLGIPEGQVHVGREMIVTTPVRDNVTRALHGDVGYRFMTSDGESIVDTVEAMAEEIRECVDLAGQVVIIFDSVVSLFSAKERLGAILDGIGIAREYRLAINSWDDSQGAGIDRYFSVGRDRDPKAFRVVVGTASIEIGVTLKATLLIMDAGFDSASFVQRAGRVARGDKSGNVVVHVPQNLDRKGWLVSAMTVLSDKGKTVPVEVLEAAFLSQTADRFRTAANDLGDGPPGEFRAMSQRAVWCSALFWVAMALANHLYKGQRESLKAFQPEKTRLVWACILDLLMCDAPAAKTWGRAFLAEAAKFRDIAPTVTISVQGGRSYTVPWRVYASHTELASAPVTVCPRTNRITVQVAKELGELLSASEKVRVRTQVLAKFPDSSSGIPLSADSIVDEWLMQANKSLNTSSHRKSVEKALKAAITLVRLSGIVPEMDGEAPVLEIEGSLVV